MAISKNKNRYQAMIIFISLFVIIIISVLATNFYFSSQFADNATEINLAGRQRMLSQKQAKIIQKLIQAQAKNQGIEETILELNGVYDLFNKTLNAFTDGGTTKDASGKLYKLKAVKGVRNKDTIKQANSIWNKYGDAVNKLLTSDTSSLLALSEAVDYAKSKNKQILELMDNLTQSLVNNNAKNIYVNLSGRQRMLSQRITKSLLELINAQSANTETSDLLALLSKDTKNFNETLRLFLNGGDITSTQGTVTSLKAIAFNDSINLTKQGEKIWLPLSHAIENIFNSDTSIFETVANANEYASKDNINLLNLMNELTVSLDQDLSRRSNILRYIQVFGILLAFIMFGFIMFYFMKQLKSADSKLDEAREEVEEILDTVNDGLFLINEEHVIGEQHSTSLKHIINVKNPKGLNFLSILRKIVPEKTLQTAKDYLDLLYGDRVHADLVKDLNPLNEVEVYFSDEGINKSVGYLGFDFTRVTKEGGNPHLLVQVEDITQKIKLEKQLAESQDAAQAQLDLMLQVLHVQPDILGVFLRDTEDKLNEVNQILQQKTDKKHGHKNKLDSIARYMHRIKGDASGLELEGFEKRAHEFENLFGELKDKSELSGKDFLPVVIKLDEFIKEIDSLKALIAKLGELQGSISDADSYNLGNTSQDEKIKDNNMSSTLYNLTNSVAKKQDKEVILNIFNKHLIPKNQRKSIQDVLTQLIRNSIVHGIEKPKNRTKHNKTIEGVIRVNFSNDENNNLILDYLDDGIGLNKENIISSAIDKGLITEKVSNSMSDNQVFSLIFKSGFSTKKNIDTDAGRGVGMDVIYDLVRTLKGKIALASKIHKFFRLRIKIPTQGE